MTEFFSGDKIGNESEDYRKGGMKGTVLDGKKRVFRASPQGHYGPSPPRHSEPPHRAILNKAKKQGSP